LLIVAIEWCCAGAQLVGGADGLSRALYGIVAAGVVLSFVLVMQQLLTPLTRMFEGYWGGSGIGRKLMQVCAPGDTAVGPVDQIIQQRQEPDRALQAYRLRHQRFPRERSGIHADPAGERFPGGGVVSIR